MPGVYRRPQEPFCSPVARPWCMGWGLTGPSAANAARSLGRGYPGACQPQPQESCQDKRQPETRAPPTAKWTQPPPRVCMSQQGSGKGQEKNTYFLLGVCVCGGVTEREGRGWVAWRTRPRIPVFSACTDKSTRLQEASVHIYPQEFSVLRCAEPRPPWEGLHTDGDRDPSPPSESPPCGRASPGWDAWLTSSSLSSRYKALQSRWWPSPCQGPPAFHMKMGVWPGRCPSRLVPGHCDPRSHPHLAAGAAVVEQPLLSLPTR